MFMFKYTVVLTYKFCSQLPEMLRVPLVELGLQIKLLRLGNIAAFLEKV